MKVLVCDPISKLGLCTCSNNGLETIVLDRCHSEEELLPIMKDISAMAVRSETKVTKTILEADLRCGSSAALGSVWTTSTLRPPHKTGSS